MRIGLLLIVFVLVHTAWGQGDVEVLDLERQVQSKVALNQVRTYQLTIPSDLTQLLHLFVVAEGETSDPLDTPDVVIQKGENTWRCVKKERADVCLVNSSNVNANDVFTVKVSCTYECTYFLRAYLSLQYKMDLVDGPANRDIMVTSSEVRVVIDPKIALFVSGSELDYSDDIQNGGFKVKNPNAATSCSCGESFSA